MVSVTLALKHRLYADQCRAEMRVVKRENAVEQPKPASGATPAGDPFKMRGIPIQMRGVPGVSPGTGPGDNLGLNDPDDWSDARPGGWSPDQWSGYYGAD